MQEDDVRPDPDELLKKIQDDEQKTHRGRLKIFLGAAAGVGKTYNMLKVAGGLAADGVNIVIGYIETHGRAETSALIPPNVPVIPLKSISYKGNILKEFDIDAALSLKPDIIIVDELAHSNVSGSRNAKRYQDVLELLNAGISVYTALNVQHIESLNNIVEQITETKITETVPDQIIDDADEVVLIDLPPEELIERLHEGKIYPQERIEPALNNFFRKGNLTALRELSLRKTAQKVDKQVLEYRNTKAIDNLWASGDKLLLVLEPGYSSEKMVRYGKNAFDKGFTEWFVGYVEVPTSDAQSLRQQQEIADLIELAKKLGATPLQLVGIDPASAIAATVNEYNISTVMLAQYRLPLYYKLFGKSLSDQLTELVPGISINLIGDEPIRHEHSYTTSKRQVNYVKLLRKIIYFFSLFSAMGIIAHPLLRILDDQNILLLYLLVLMVTSNGRGKASAVIAALMGALSFDFFVINSYFSFTALDLQYIITCCLLIAVSLTFSVMNGNLRFRVSRLSKVQQRSELLQEFNQYLAIAMTEKQVIEAFIRVFPVLFSDNYMLLLPDLNEELQLQSQVNLAEYMPSIADWVFNNGQAAGLNTDTFATNHLAYIPILSKVRARGVVVIKPEDNVTFFLPDIQIALDYFLEQLANTLERIHFTQIAIQTEMLLAKQRAIE